MSNKQHKDATLQGYEGPFFPDTLRELHCLIENQEVSAAVLEEVCSLVEGFIGPLRRPMTDDGYGWYWAIQFSKASGLVMLLIPWFQDWDKKDNTEADRSLAVLTQKANMADVNSAIGGLIAAFRKKGW